MVHWRIGEVLTREVAAAKWVVRVLEVAFWTLLLLMLPLSVAPSKTAEVLSVQDFIYRPKALILSIASVTGVVGVLLAYTRLTPAEIWSSLRASPLAIRSWVLLTALTFFIPIFHSSYLSVTLIGSAARFDGALVRCLWLICGLSAFAFCWRRPRSVFLPLVLGTVGATIVGIWAALQTMGIEPMWWFGFDGALPTTPIASLGHRAFVSCLVAMFLAILQGWISARGVWRWWQVVLCILLGSFVIIGGGRAGLIAYAVSWVFNVYVLVTLKLKMRAMLVVTAASLVGIVGALVVSPSGPRAITTIVDAAQGKDGSFKARYEYFWPIAVRAIVERPILGWGIEGYSNAFWELSSKEEQDWVVRSHISRLAYPILRTTGTPIQLVRRGRFAPEEIYFFTIDRAHNALLDAAVSFGLPYAFVLMVVLASAGHVIVVSRNLPALAFTAGAITYIVFSLAWFDTLQLSPIFWTILGASVGVASNDRKKGATLGRL